MSVAAQLRPIVRARAVAMHRLAVRMTEADLDRRVPRVKGNLARSKRVSYSLGANVLSARIEYTARQAEWTDKGTRPHVIVPRRARVLRFPAVGRGRQPVSGRGFRGRRAFSPVGVRFAMRVNHPGNKGNGWFTKAVTPAKWSGYLRAAGRTLG